MSRIRVIKQSRKYSPQCRREPRQPSPGGWGPRGWKAELACTCTTGSHAPSLMAATPQRQARYPMSRTGCLRSVRATSDPGVSQSQACTCLSPLGPETEAGCRQWQVGMGLCRPHDLLAAPCALATGRPVSRSLGIVSSCHQPLKLPEPRGCRFTYQEGASLPGRGKFVL